MLNRSIKASIRSKMPDSLYPWYLNLYTRYHACRNVYLDWRRSKSPLSARTEAGLPHGVFEYLTRSNPKLIDLERRYANKSLFTDTFWKSWRQRVDLKNFRGEGHYLTQRRGHNPEGQYLATTVYTELVDDWGLLQSLKEDGLFGCHTYRLLDDFLVSRDLLDSILEITSLRSTLGFGRRDELGILDIGAGYGRFAHRFLQTFQRAAITNVDGVAESTFLCDFYTRFRGLGEQSTTVPADELQRLEKVRFDLAVNIHSWSECSRDTVRFWLRRLRDLRVPRLFVVPHDENFTTTEPGWRRDTFLPEITAVGYALARKVHKFDRSACLQPNGLDPSWYFFFEGR